jgi:hypothetical protein
MLTGPEGGGGATESVVVVVVVAKFEPLGPVGSPGAETGVEDDVEIGCFFGAGRDGTATEEEEAEVEADDGPVGSAR